MKQLYFGWMQSTEKLVLFTFGNFPVVYLNQDQRIKELLLEKQKGKEISVHTMNPGLSR